MLVLSRKSGEQIVVNGGGLVGDVIIEIIEIKGQSVRLGIVADKDVDVNRAEIAEAKRLYPRTLD